MAGVRECLVRYGAMGRVARFPAESEEAEALSRGRAVVVQTERGRELGEVLLVLETGPPGPAGAEASEPGAGERRVLRSAGPDDRADAERLIAARHDRLALCQRFWDEAGWPWSLVDIEATLDDAATVLYYLGPSELDTALLRARFRAVCGFDVVLEPVGDDAAEIDHQGETGRGGCGDCGAGGGCGGCGGGPALDRASADGIAQATGCGPGSHGGCSSCGIREWAARAAREAEAEAAAAAHAEVSN